MARSYATFDCGIWDDGDFIRLSAGAQRTYFMLVTQRDITACGSLALTLRRWGNTCSEQDIKAWLEELAEARYVLIDEDTEELLVRTFMKWDAGYKHAQRAKAVIATALAIRSQSIRDAAVRELRRLGVSVPYPEPLDSHSIATPEPVEVGRSVVNKGDHISTPHSTLPKPHSAHQEREPEPSDASVGPPPMFCSKHPDGTEESCGPCGTAKARYKRHLEDTVEREAAARAERARAIRDCELCDEHGMRLDDDTGQPLERCTHPNARRTA